MFIRIAIIFAVLFCVGNRLSESVQSVKKKKGLIMVAGGGPLPEDVLRRFVHLAGGPSAKLIIVPTASNQPRSAEQLIKYWSQFGSTNVVVLNASSRDVANSREFCSSLTDATAVWFGGGDQQRLMDIYYGTEFYKHVVDIYERGGILGGTSAGASIFSEFMPYEGSSRKGFGIVRLVIDQHFDTRNRLGRLLDILSKHQINGIGIDECTAAVIDGVMIKEVVGKRTVSQCISGSPINVMRPIVSAEARAGK